MKDALGREYDERPWGSFTVLDDTADDHKVKRLTIAPHKRLSYQRHAFRSEHLFVVAGTATVVLDGVEHTLAPGGSIEVPVGTAHRYANSTDEPVVLIEVQTGSYFGEDDIVRLEDDFGRTE